MKNPACVFQITRNADNERDVAYFIYDLLWRNTDESIEIDLHQQTKIVLLFCSTALDEELEELMNEHFIHPIDIYYGKYEDDIVFCKHFRKGKLCCQKPLSKEVFEIDFEQ